MLGLSDPLSLLPPEPITLVASYSRTQFLRSCRVGAEESRFLVAREFELQPHLPVRVELFFRGGPHRFSIYGEASYSVLHPTHRELSGVVVSVRGSQHFQFGAAVAVARGLPIWFGRRTHFRCPVWIPVRYGAPGDEQHGYLVDVSVAGARIETWNERPALGDAVTLQVGDPTHPGLAIPGEVMTLGFQQGIPRFGVRFGALGEPSRAWLAALVARASPPASSTPSPEEARVAARAFSSL